MSDYTPELPPLAAYGPGDLDDTALANGRHRNGTSRNGHRPAAAVRRPAQNLDAEEALLGAALLSAEARNATVDLVDPSDFYRHGHQHIWHAIRTIHARGEPVDQVTVAHELGGLLDAVGGPAALTSLIAATPGTRNADRYARIITDMALLRRITAVANEIATQAYQLPDDPRALADTAAEALQLLTSTQLAAADPRLIAGDRFILDTPPGVPAIWGDDTGNVLWAEGESLLLVGPPGVGKTTLGGQLVFGLLGLRPDLLGYPIRPTDGRVLYLACDRPRQIARALNRLTDPTDAHVLAERLAVWQGPPPADAGDDPGVLHRMARQAGATAIVIDSLKDIAVNLNDDRVGGNVNRALQGCLAEGIDVLVYHHQNKGDGTSKPKELKHVYGSSMITNGAGSVVLLWGDAGDLVVELGHLKQPANQVGPFKVVHDHDHGTSSVHDRFDAVAYMRHAGPHGVTSRDVARAMFDKPDPTENQIQKARRELQRLDRAGLVMRRSGTFGGEGGSQADRYHLVDRTHEDHAQ